ncbi:MAG: 2-oxoacid:acceptor oxidoreductase subunit alpha [Acidobacteriota bacterium]
MQVEELVIGMAGKGGDGVVTAGDVLASGAASEGLNCFMLKSFGPQIRGGESSCRIRISTEQITSQGDRIDILVVLSWEDYAKFAAEFVLKDGVVVLCEEKDEYLTKGIPVDERSLSTLYRIPFIQITKEKVGSQLVKNMVLIGILCGLFGFSKEAMVRGIAKKFGRKKETMELNLKGLNAGYEYAVGLKKTDPIEFSYVPSRPNMILDGNEAIAYGALYAGCRFFAGYPITPASEIMEWLSRELPKFDGVMVQAEDEIAAAGMCIGASFAGVKAMTATSGPGLSLMSEMIGLSSMAEIPLVIVDVQRVGPATGIPTKSEQSDLQQALYGTHGDANRVVLAPSDVEDCFDVTVEAFYISEKYQLPVIILSDQFIGHRKESIKMVELMEHNGFTKRFERIHPSIEELKDYKRYRFTEAGVSPMSSPGIKGGQYTAVGIEHDEYGCVVSTADNHESMNKKRFDKCHRIREEFHFIRKYGPEDAPLGVIAWGSSKGAVKEAVLRANEEGIKVSALVPQIIHPLPFKKFEEFFRPLKKAIIVELSYSAQFLKYLRSHFHLPFEQITCKRSGAKALSVEEVLTQIHKAAE